MHHQPSYILGVIKQVGRKKFNNQIYAHCFDTCIQVKVLPSKHLFILNHFQSEWKLCCSSMMRTTDKKRKCLRIAILQVPRGNYLYECTIIGWHTIFKINVTWIYVRAHKVMSKWIFWEKWSLTLSQIFYEILALY